MIAKVLIIRKDLQIIQVVPASQILKDNIIVDFIPPILTVTIIIGNLIIIQVIEVTTTITKLEVIMEHHAVLGMFGDVVFLVDTSHHVEEMCYNIIP